ncbi:MAG: lactate racemase domain-containing protein, partial [Desulfobacteraceae bacterium]
PDSTRSCPLPMMIRALNTVMGNLSAKLDFMVALGTHALMSQRQILNLYGIDPKERRSIFCKSDFLNHRWDLDDTFHQIGELDKKKIAEISNHRLVESVPIVINKKIFEYDHIIVLSPVFPHEVVGFSGGAKYFFPGISGGEFLHFFHWLGAVMTNVNTIGMKETPMRKAIDLAMEKITVPIHCLAMVVASQKELCGLFIGDIKKTWSRAADISAVRHVITKDRSFTTVLGCAPSMYDEIWTAGKVMYKLEPVVADGGRLIIYGPHINKISKTWGHIIEKIGYHVRDYFLLQMERFNKIPRGVLAHSTHVRGSGTFVNGIECGRIEVILATSIPPEKCRQINLGYMDPDKIKLKEYKKKETEGILFVERAGEVLYKVSDTPRRCKK